MIRFQTLNWIFVIRTYALAAETRLCKEFNTSVRVCLLPSYEFYRISAQMFEFRAIMPRMPTSAITIKMDAL